MDKYMYRALVILLLVMIWITQFASLMSVWKIINISTNTQIEVEHIRDTVDGWEVEVRY